MRNAVGKVNCKPWGKGRSSCYSKISCTQMRDKDRVVVVVVVDDGDDGGDGGDGDDEDDGDDDEDDKDDDTTYQ